MVVPDGARQTWETVEVATIEVYTDADWEEDVKSLKSTSSLFTRIDGFIIGMNATVARHAFAEQRRKRVLRAQSSMRRWTLREKQS